MAKKQEDKNDRRKVFRSVGYGVARRNDRRSWVAMVGAFAMVFVFAFLMAKYKDNNAADAANLGAFDAGYIMSDYQMGNYNSMSEADIQNFLKQKGNCNDTRTYLADYYTSYSYHIRDGHFVCLADETFGDGTAYGNSAPNGASAAHIIWQAAQDYRINPQVIIVLLQKEQGLITDSWPNNRQYRSATGYGCPDTAACDSKYYGFKNQVRQAAAMFRTVLDGGWTNYPLGWNYVQYNPDVDCGGSWVNIRSLATSVLYRYTPYQPNSAALAAGYGTGDSCSAYGNRNFYSYFEDWFGGIKNSVVSFEEMLDPRVMTIKKDTLLIDAQGLKTTDEWLIAGNNYYFTKKAQVFWGGEKQVCLQREEDVGSTRCVLMQRTSEFSLENAVVKFDEVREYEVSRWTCEIEARNLNARCGAFARDVGYTFYSDGVVMISGKEYFRKTNSNNVFLAQRVRRKLAYVGVGPKLMKLTVNSYKYRDGERNDIVQTLTTSQNPFIVVMDKTVIFGRVYYRTMFDHNNNNNYLIPERDLSDDIFSNFLYPRNLIVSRDAYSVNLDTGKKCTNYRRGIIKKYVKKISYDGIEYFQSDEDGGSHCAISAVNLNETEYNFNDANVEGKFIDFLMPRNLKVNRDTYLIDLRTGKTCNESLRVGDVQRYETKIEINGIVFYRSKVNTESGSTCAVPAVNLSETI